MKRQVTTTPVYVAEYRAYDGERLVGVFIDRAFEPIRADRWESPNGYRYVGDACAEPAYLIVHPSSYRLRREFGDCGEYCLTADKEVVKPARAVALAAASAGGWRFDCAEEIPAPTLPERREPSCPRPSLF